MKKPMVNRRTFLKNTAAAVAVTGLACKSSAQLRPDASSGGVLDATPGCGATEDNILGPFYRAGAPFRSDLAEPNKLGTRLTVSGRMFGTDCAPLSGAVLDLWQADDAGHYDNDGSRPQPGPGEFILRGRVQTDPKGGYSFRTIIPGHYLNGQQFRPAHIHVMATAPDHATLVTQLYFEGDPYNDIDSFIKQSLIMPIADGQNGEKVASYDIVLATV